MLARNYHSVLRNTSEEQRSQTTICDNGGLGLALRGMDQKDLVRHFVCKFTTSNTFQFQIYEKTSSFIRVNTVIVNETICNKLLLFEFSNLITVSNTTYNMASCTAEHLMGNCSTCAQAKQMYIAVLQQL
jgi:hypothetical protein